MKSIFLCLLMLLLIVSCSTPYQRVSFMGGYAETQLDENVFRVSFRGNAYTSKEKVADLCLLRSAELALQKGYSYFLVVDEQQYSKMGAYTTPTSTTTTGVVTGSGNTAVGRVTSNRRGGQTYLYSKPRNTIIIVCFNEKPNIQGLVFNANFIRNSLKSTYSIKYPVSY
ncbi:MAG: hypothetical protein ABIJ52_15415 [Pseudomonadota bacterium]